MYLFVLYTKNIFFFFEPLLFTYKITIIQKILFFYIPKEKNHNKNIKKNMDLSDIYFPPTDKIDNGPYKKDSGRFI